MHSITMSNVNPLLLRKLDLNSLVALHSLLATQSVSRSAAQLCIGQPAVSHILKHLRQVLGDELLCRCGRGMVLTPFATELFVPLTHWLEQGQLLFQSPHPFNPAAVCTTVRVAMPDLLESAVLPRLIAYLQQNAPGVVLEVEAMPAPEVDAALEQGRIASAMGYFPDLGHRFLRQPLFQAAFVVMYNPRRLSLPDPLTLSDLALPPHVYTSYAGSSASIVDAYFQQRALERRVIASCASLLAIPAILEQVPAVAVLPEMIAQVMTRYDRALVMRPISDCELRVPIEQVWHPRLAQDPLQGFIREAVARQVAELAPG